MAVNLRKGAPTSTNIDYNVARMSVLEYWTWCRLLGSSRTHRIHGSLARKSQVSECRKKKKKKKKFISPPALKSFDSFSHYPLHNLITRKERYPNKQIHQTTQLCDKASIFITSRLYFLHVHHVISVKHQLY